MTATRAMRRRELEENIPTTTVVAAAFGSLRMIGYRPRLSSRNKAMPCATAKLDGRLLGTTLCDAQQASLLRNTRNATIGQPNSVFADSHSIYLLHPRLVPFRLDNIII